MATNDTASEHFIAASFNPPKQRCIQMKFVAKSRCGWPDDYLKVINQTPPDCSWFLTNQARHTFRDFAIYEFSGTALLFFSSTCFSRTFFSCHSALENGLFIIR
jgi:hypothetical protein